MSSPLIQLEAVSVRYPVEPLVQKSLKDLASLVFYRRRTRARFVEALRELSLTFQSGQRIGIIGANGAGKSTLLRTIAGIYPVESGRLTVNGRVNALFDLGVGFEVSDTGRHNIYLRGYLLGLTKKEIQFIEDDIIDFSGLGQFIDLPLKSYSSGMQVRLAFAISTAVESEILLIDEVIGAGDAEFHLRARSRLQGMIAKSKCMILVSHDLNTIREFCNVGLWLDSGKLKFMGPTHEAIERYEDYVEGASSIAEAADSTASANIARQPIDFIRTRPMWPNVQIIKDGGAVEISTTDVPWSFTAEFPLTRYFQRPGTTGAIIHVKLRVLEGQISAGVVDSSYLKIAGEKFYEPGEDHDITLHATRSQHSGAIIFRKGSVAEGNKARAVVLDLQMVIETDDTPAAN